MESSLNSLFLKVKVALASLRDLFQKLVNRSNDFEKSVPFPVEENDIRYCFPPEEVVENARKCRPVLHAEVVRHIVNFLEYKVTPSFNA